jgi:hypothetical protein
MSRGEALEVGHLAEDLFGVASKLGFKLGCVSAWYGITILLLVLALKVFSWLWFTLFIFVFAIFIIIMRP